MSIIPYDSTGGVLKQIAQWDTGVTVTVTDDSITDDCVLQFGSKGGRLAYQVDTTVDGTTLTGTIPGVVAAQAKTIVGYVVKTADTAARTIGTFEIRVIPRVRPSDLVYTSDDEWISLRSIKEMVTDLTNGLISDDILSEAVNNWLEANGIDLDTLDEDDVQALIDASLTDYATQAYVAEQITTALTDGTIDLSIYSTTSEVQALIDAAVADVTVDLSDYSTTTEVQEMIDAAIATVDGSEAAAYAEAAAASAAAAAESASAASTSETNAAASATAAAASASEASGYADSASVSAAAAATSASEAADSAAAAASSASAASTSETNAASSATAAASSASEAATAVESVSETVEAALTAAKESGEFDGADGADGATGADGKSAYETAVEGGYTGTEDEFASALASMATLLNGEEAEW